MLDRFGPALVLRTGACLFGGGLILCGFSSSLPWFFVCYSFIVCGGAGLTYCAVLMNINNFYPDKRGSASGLVTACYGLSAVFLSPVSTYLIGAFGVLYAYKMLGAFFFAIILCSSFFIKRAPFDDAETLNGPHFHNDIDISWNDMIKTKQFSVIFSLMIIGASAGLMIISQAAVLAQYMMGAGAVKAAYTLSLIAVANTLGRILWGGISDRIGRNMALHFIYVTFAVALIGLSLISVQYALFTLFAMMVTFCYGGIASTFPAIISEHFGSRHSGTNYGIALIGIGLGSFIGTPLIALSHSLTPGNFDLAFLVSAALCGFGFFLTFALKKLK